LSKISRDRPQTRADRRAADAKKRGRDGKAKAAAQPTTAGGVQWADVFDDDED
jgi:hypothetical protein